MAFQRVLVATDFGDCSRAAVEQAVSLAEFLGASLCVVHVIHVPYSYVSSLMGELMTQLQDRARTDLEQALEPLRRRIPGVSGVVRWGIVAEEIFALAHDSHADLIVTGAHGTGAHNHVQAHLHLTWPILGSTAERIVRDSSVPVLTVHRHLSQGGAAWGVSAPQPGMDQHA
jgi:nucleotide-binding universal stress UspA family protein